MRPLTRRTAGLIAPALLVLTARPAAAQHAGTPGVLEIGGDASISYETESEVTSIAVPVQQVRVGVFFSPRLSLEPALGFNRASGGGGSASALDLSLGLVAHLTGVPVGPGQTTSLYVRPFGGLRRVAGRFEGQGQSATQFQLGGGLGFKAPLISRLAARAEVFYAHGFDNNNFGSSNDVGLRAGLSFFTR